MKNTPPLSFDFANILFSGKCNAKCPYCIGQELNITYPSNLDTFPLKSIDQFIWLIQEYNIPEVIFTGTTTDPQLYRHEDKLLSLIWDELPNTRRAIHTNGFLILRKIDTFNQYSKCTLSLPSFNQEVFEIMMGTRQKVPDINEISKQSHIPIKVSRIVDPNNDFFTETEHFINKLSGTDVHRVAFRKLAWDVSSWEPTIRQLEKLWAQYTWDYRNNPIYKIDDIEITLWSFDTSSSKSINLFSNGHISHQYLLSDSKK